MRAGWLGQGLGIVVGAVVALSALQGSAVAARHRGTASATRYASASHGGFRHVATQRFARSWHPSWQRSALQCVPFARENSGIELSGNAGTWWNNATGLYERGARPEVGSILNFRATGHIANGPCRGGHERDHATAHRNRPCQLGCAGSDQPEHRRGRRFARQRLDRRPCRAESVRRLWQRLSDVWLHLRPAGSWRDGCQQRADADADIALRTDQQPRFRTWRPRRRRRRWPRPPTTMACRLPRATAAGIMASVVATGRCMRASRVTSTGREWLPDGLHLSRQHAWRRSGSADLAPIGSPPRITRLTFPPALP